MDTLNLSKKERKESVKGLKTIFEDIHNWVGKQSMIVQIGILFVAGFLVIACLMGIAT